MWKWRWWFCCLAVAVGAIRLAGWFPAAGEQGHVFNYVNGHKQAVHGTIVALPDIRRDKQQLIVQPANLTGRLLLTVPSFPVYRFGQSIDITCSFKRPESIDGFAYHLWLAARRVFAVCSQGEVLVTAEPAGWRKIIGTVRARAVTAVQQSLPEPVASLAAAMVFAERGMLSPQTLNSLSASGVAHIISVSGMHVSILTLVLWQGLLAAGCSRRGAAALVGGALLAFLVCIGWPAPAVRAAAMGGLVVLASVTGRLPHGPWLLLFVAVVTFAANPLLVVVDIGWQLSITAMAGLVLVAGPLDRWCAQHMPWLPERWGVRTAVSTSIAAQLTTAPLSFSAFGQVSLVAPLTNLVVAPLITPLMAATLLVVLCKLVIPIVTVLPAAAVWGCGMAFLYSAELLSQLPGSTVQWQMSLPAVGASYGVMICAGCGYWYWHRSA